MRRLNFLADEPWDEVEDDKRVRWFGHPFGTDHPGASLIEYPPQAPGGPMLMHYGVEERWPVAPQARLLAHLLVGLAPTVQLSPVEKEAEPGTNHLAIANVFDPARAQVPRFGEQAPATSQQKQPP